MYCNRSPTAYITPVDTELGTKPAPFMASFSSRGPNVIEPAILKVNAIMKNSLWSVSYYFRIILLFLYYFQPDITAPGVSIIAAFSEATSPTDLEFDKRRVPFNIVSGTSMSCPHVAGIVGLLKTLHPDWSPAAIKSAIMTTGTNKHLWVHHQNLNFLLS